MLTLTETPASGAQHVSGTTLFYRPGGSGTFRVDAATSDPETGIAQVAFPSIANVTGGSTQTSSPYQETYTWGASTSDNGSHNIVATNNSGASSSAGFTLKPDSTAPSGQSISLGGAGAYYTTSVPFILGDGSDNVGGSGLDLSSRAVTRETANLVGDACGSFTADPGTYTSPDASVTGGHCYRYSFAIKDHVGNTSVPTTTVAKVDTAASPAVGVTAPTETVGAANQYYDSTSKTQFFRPGASGSFTLNATASDTHTAVTQVAFPNVSATSGWGGSTGGPDITSPYASPNRTPGRSARRLPGRGQPRRHGQGREQRLRHDHDRGRRHGPDRADADAHGRLRAVLHVDVGHLHGRQRNRQRRRLGPRPGVADGHARDGEPSRQLVRRLPSDPGTFSSPDTSVSSGHCYRYTFTIADNVGNVSAPVTVTAKVDTTAPSTPSLSFGAFTNASVTGSTVFFRQSAAGGFTVSSSSGDTETGISSTSFPSFGSGWTNTGGVYSFDGTATAPAGSQNVTSRNGAGIDSAAATFTVVADPTAPVSSVQCNGAACSGGWYTTAPVSVTLSASDGFGSGLDKIRYTTDGSDPTLLNGSDYAGAIPVAATTTIKFRAYDNVGNIEAVATQTVQVDTTPPSAPALTLGEASPYEYATGTTLFYNPNGSNSAAFTVSGTSTDASPGSNASASRRSPG